MKKTYDPRMHSAEHLLNQTMVRLFDCGRCFSAHIEKKKSKCDYHFQRPLKEEEVRDVESRVNQVIRANLPVTEELVSLEEAEAQVNLERLPEDTEGKIRIIKIGDYDACPCIGPHVNKTSDIGRFRITTTSFEDGVLRIRYKLSSD
jgi:Ser-tRNA(Ala) deacylase AlaX